MLKVESNGLDDDIGTKDLAPFPKVSLIEDMQRELGTGGGDVVALVWTC